MHRASGEGFEPVTPSEVQASAGSWSGTGPCQFSGTGRCFRLSSPTGAGRARTYSGTTTGSGVSLARRKLVMKFTYRVILGRKKISSVAP